MQEQRYINPGYSVEMEKAFSSEKDYEFLGGKLPQEVIVEDGDWRPFYPKFEEQRKAIDSYSCVSFANNNAEEMIHKARYGEEINRSDRFLSVISGTVPGKGNGQKRVAETKRKMGIVQEEEYPFTDIMTQSEFFRYPSRELIEKGLQWTVATEYGYEEVQPKDYTKALRLSPLQVGVDSRTNKKSNFTQQDHSVVISFLDFKGVAYAYDSYLGRIDTYEPGYPFGIALRFHYKKVVNVTIGGYEMKLVRDPFSGKIFFCDSDNRLHHCEAPTDFFEFFGKRAWDQEQWINLTPEEFRSYKEGLTISAKKTNFAMSVAELFKTFGKSKS